MDEEVPVSDAQKHYYITTPIYYVNDVPHVGHAYTSVAADTLARFKRLDGYDVRFLTGTDEHGQKVEKSAAKVGKDPQDFVDEVSARFRELADALDLSNDIFMRTTSPEHKKAATELWKRLTEAGYIYEGSYAGWYSVRDEAYYQEAELVDGKAPTGAEVEWVEESSYFFKLSALEDKLLAFYDAHPDAIGPKSRRNEVLSFIKGGLKDLSISRSTFKWGVPVPNDPAHVMYVWIDALTNYLTGLGFPDHNIDDHWAESVHLIGKDILRFHCVYWHAFLIAAGITPPKRVFAHGWWTSEGQKMSKSLGNVVDPFEMINTYGLDQFRYFMLREVPFGSDGDFSKSALVTRINSDLANDLGNLIQRVVSFVYKNNDAKLPTPSEYTQADKDMLKMADDMLPTLREHADTQALSKLVETIWSVIGEANRYVDQEQPWALKKTDTVRMQTVLFVLLEVIRKVAIPAQAILPTTAPKILDMLKVPSTDRTLDHVLTGALTHGAEIEKPEGLFPRIQVAAD